MARNRNHDGVHQTHCCWYHGCKYGDDREGGDGCPVVSGDIEQAYSCEDCSMHGWNDIPPKELTQIDDTVGVWMGQWLDGDLNLKDYVVQEVIKKRDYFHTFWFIAKLGACNRIGEVWEFAKLYKKYRERKHK